MHPTLAVALTAARRVVVIIGVQVGQTVANPPGST